MAINFDGDALVITLSSGVTTVDWQDVYSDWKDWMLETPLNRRYPKAFRPDGGGELTSIIDQGRYYFFANDSGWRIKPPEENITIFAVGNLAVETTDLPALVPTDGAFTTAILGLQPVTQGVTPVMAAQLEHGSFDGGVSLDMVKGFSGTGNVPSGEPIGSTAYPSNNISDTLSILNERGFLEVFIRGSAALSSGDFSEGIRFSGLNAVVSSVVLEDLTNVNNCEFEALGVSGILDDLNVFQNCLVGDVTSFDGFLRECGVIGTITMGGTTQTTLNNCVTINNSSPTEIKIGSGSELAVRGHSGDLILSEKTGPETAGLNLTSGVITILSSCVNGTIVVTGTGDMIDESSIGCTVVNNLVTGKLIERAIHIDTGAIDPGDGSQTLPFNTLAAALDFAESTGLKILHLLDEVEIDRNLKNFQVLGIGTPVVECNGFDLKGTEFTHCTLRGTYIDSIVGLECVLDTDFNLNGIFENCVVVSSLACLGSSVTLLRNCTPFSGIVGMTLDMGAATTAQVNISSWAGLITLDNCNQVTDNLGLDLVSGDLIINSTCTDGDIVVRGVGGLIDNSNGSTVSDESLSPRAVWNYTQ